MGKFNVEMSDEEIYARYIANGRNASALAPDLLCDPARARARVRRILPQFETHPISERRETELVNRVSELLERSGVDPNTIERLRNIRFKAWGVMAKVKGADGIERMETQGLHATSFTADPILTAADNPCLTQAPPITVTYTPSTAPRIMRKVSVVTVISDAQIGFMRGPNGLEPIHDPDAVSVMQQILAAEQPDRNIWIGDVADLTQFSRWPQRNEFDGCAQSSIDETSRILAETHAAAGSRCREDIVVGGNHDVRVQMYADSNARALSGLKRANALPDEWPVNSLPFLARFDEIGITYAGNFPSGGYWILDDLLAIHAPPKKLEFAASVIHGHTHHLTMRTSAQHSRYHRSNFFVYDTGCICKIGTRVDRQSLVFLETPSDRARSDWAQGIAVVEILEGKLPKHQVTLVKIDEGFAIHRGQAFYAPGREPVEIAA